MKLHQARGLSLAAALPLSLALVSAAQARITRIEITQIEPAYDGQAFGGTGAYERVIGKAHGELDPRAPANAQILDIALAPRNASGRVEYVADIEILRPKDLNKSNGMLLFDVVNRGNKVAPGLFNTGLAPNPAVNNALGNAGDGFLQRQGYTVVWFGWQGDVAAGNKRMALKVPVARQADGSALTGTVRSEILFLAGASTPTLSLAQGFFTGTSTVHSSVSSDNRTALADGFVPTLTVRARQNAPRTVIPNSEWSFAACPTAGAVTPSDTQLCLPAGFKRGLLYELTYRARDPLVLGIGFAAMRDIGAFLKNQKRDDAGHANPALLPHARSVISGSSQSGRFIRSLLLRGFNKDEDGRMVFDGAIPHIGGGSMPLDVRFGQPGRAAGTAEVDLYEPGVDFPFAYASIADPISGRTQGILDRCNAEGNCPKIIHAATALEMWELRQSLGFTDPLGRRDLPEPANVRSYIMASTQHSSAALPLPQAEPFGLCEQQPNPNPQQMTMRALLQAMVAWIKEGREPPPSERPTIAAGNLVAASDVKFPAIPANHYGGVARKAVRFLANSNPLFAQDYGPQFRPGEAAGVMTQFPPKLGPQAYRNLVAQVDADGNDLGGIRSVFVQVPLGTYTGWNVYHDALFKDGICTLSGSFIPFAKTRQERMNAGDPRLSVEERYPDKVAYVAALRKAADELVVKRFLLPEDAQRLKDEAEANGIRQAP